MISPLGTLFRSLASLKVAIPLLVLTVAVTIAGSLQPDTDYYRSGWYLGLLGLNGMSLLFITILHIPSIVAKKGRNALIGVVATHLGILVLIAGIIYGGIAGVRHNVKAIEGEMTVVPGLPFVIRLDELIIEDYPREAFEHMNLEMLPKKRQESRMTLYRGGEDWKHLTVGPGFPGKAGGFTILPSVNDFGWYFELVVTDPLGRESSVPVRPWAPPLVHVGETDVMVHSVLEAGQFLAQVFTLRDGQMVPLGTVTQSAPLSMEDYTVALGALRRYTAMTIYNRPHGPVLVAGSLLMMFGLIWHFYHRHRDRKKSRGDATNDA